MAVKTIEKMREYNIALFQSIKDAMFNTIRYKRDYNAQERLLHQDNRNYATYILEFIGPNAFVEVTVNENIDVMVYANTLPLTERRSYRYFDINDFAVDGKVDMNFQIYRNNTVKLFKYLFEEAYIMPYDNRQRMCQKAHIVLVDEQPCYEFWVLRFLKEHSFSDIMELKKWLAYCANKYVFREKDVMMSIDCADKMLEDMVQQNELSEEAYNAIHNRLRHNGYEMINHRYY